MGHWLPRPGEMPISAFVGKADIYGNDAVIRARPAGIAFATRDPLRRQRQPIAESQQPQIYRFSGLLRFDRGQCSSGL
jgi:hypothetical protein